MKLVSGDRLWTKTNPIPYKYPYLSEDIDCDILIIGAGIIGAICSYYLTSPGIKTVLVDRNIVGYCSTSASTSILQYEVDTDLSGLSSMIGLENAVRSFKINEKAVYDIEELVSGLGKNCGFERKESLYYTYKVSDVQKMQKEYELRKNNGLDVEFLDKEVAKKLFSFNIEAGILSKSGSGIIDPYKFTHELIFNSTQRGLSMYENTEIVQIHQQNGDLQLITHNDKTIKAKKVVIASGYEAVKYINEKIASFSRSFTIVSKPVKSFNGWHNQCIVRDNESTYNYLRSTCDNRIIIGGEDLELGGIHSKVSNLDGAEQLQNEKYNILESKVKQYFPQINDIEIEYKFNGIFATTKDGLPYIGEYKNMPNCYFCLCYGSNGILYGILGAKLIQELYNGNYPNDLELYKFGR